MQRVFQQVHAVVVAVIALYQKLVCDFHRLAGTVHGILVKAFRVGYPHVRVEQAAHVGGIHARGYPPFPEIEIQILKRYLFGYAFAQCRQ